jgi:hypothetical protein
VTIKMNYDQGSVTGIDEAGLKIFRNEGLGWSELNGCSVDSNNNEVACSTSNFSIFGLFGQAAVPTATPTPTTIPSTNPANSPEGQNNSNSGGGSQENSPPGCSNQSPKGKLDLFEIRTNGKSATLFFTPPSSNFSNIYVAFSRKPDVWEYGVEYSQQNTLGVMNYTINLLKPNTKYYFKVRTGNGCATGEWSNTMQVKTTNSTKSIKKFYKNIMVAVVQKVKTILKK